MLIKRKGKGFGRIEDFTLFNLNLDFTGFEIGIYRPGRARNNGPFNGKDKLAPY